MNRLLKRDIERITERLRQRYNPQKIILFGSAARGGFREGGDIDFLVIKNVNKPMHKRIVDIYKLLRGIEREYAADFIVLTPKELRQRLELGDFLIRNIFEEGRILYESKSLLSKIAFGTASGTIAMTKHTAPIQQKSPFKGLFAAFGHGNWPGGILDSILRPQNGSGANLS